jgi:protein arginine N-methyltransferase 7
MAEIARVTAANDPERITVFPLRSTDLSVSPENGHLPCRADILVSELFDSILLGEAVLPTIQHAISHLLVPIPINHPESAVVYAQVVQNEHLYRLTLVHTKLNSNGAHLSRNKRCNVHRWKSSPPTPYTAIRN